MCDKKKKRLIFAMQSHICHSDQFLRNPWGTNTKSKNLKFLSSTNLSDPVIKQIFTKELFYPEGVQKSIDMTLAQCSYPFECTHASDSSSVISHRDFTEEVNRSVKSKPIDYVNNSFASFLSCFALAMLALVPKQSMGVKALMTQFSNDSLGVTAYSYLPYTGKSPRLLQISGFTTQSLCFVSEGDLPLIGSQLPLSMKTLSKQNYYLYSKPFLAFQLFTPKEYKFSLLRTLLAPRFHYGKYNVNKESKSVGISKTNFVRSRLYELDVRCQQLLDNKEITLLCLPALYYLLPLMKHYYPREILFFSFVSFSDICFANISDVGAKQEGFANIEDVSKVLKDVKTRKSSVSGVSQFEYWKEPRVEKDTYIKFFYPNTIHRLYSLQNTNTNTEIKDFYFFNFFVYFFQFRLKKGWTYWPHRVLCLPLAFHRRIVKLFLLKQKKKNIRYSKIDLISTNILDIS